MSTMNNNAQQDQESPHFSEPLSDLDRVFVRRQAQQLQSRKADEARLGGKRPILYKSAHSRNIRSSKGASTTTTIGDATATSSRDETTTPPNNIKPQPPSNRTLNNLSSFLCSIIVELINKGNLKELFRVIVLANHLQIASRTPSFNSINNSHHVPAASINLYYYTNNEITNREHFALFSATTANPDNSSSIAPSSQDTNESNNQSAEARNNNSNSKGLNFRTIISSLLRLEDERKALLANKPASTAASAGTPTPANSSGSSTAIDAASDLLLHQWENKIVLFLQILYIKSLDKHDAMGVNEVNRVLNRIKEKSGYSVTIRNVKLAEWVDLIKQRKLRFIESDSRLDKQFNEMFEKARIDLAIHHRKQTLFHLKNSDNNTAANGGQTLVHEDTTITEDELTKQMLHSMYEIESKFYSPSSKVVDVAQLKFLDFNSDKLTQMYSETSLQEHEVSMNKFLQVVLDIYRHGLNRLQTPKAPQGHNFMEALKNQQHQQVPHQERVYLCISILICCFKGRRKFYKQQQQQQQQQRKLQATAEMRGLSVGVAETTLQLLLMVSGTAPGRSCAPHIATFHPCFELLGSLYGFLVDSSDAVVIECQNAVYNIFLDFLLASPSSDPRTSKYEDAPAHVMNNPKAFASLLSGLASMGEFFTSYQQVHEMLYLLIKSARHITAKTSSPSEVFTTDFLHVLDVKLAHGLTIYSFIMNNLYRIANTLSASMQPLPSTDGTATDVAAAVPSKSSVSASIIDAKKFIEAFVAAVQQAYQEQQSHDDEVYSCMFAAAAILGFLSQNEQQSLQLETLLNREELEALQHTLEHVLLSLLHKSNSPVQQICAYAAVQHCATCLKNKEPDLALKLLECLLTYVFAEKFAFDDQSLKNDSTFKYIQMHHKSKLFSNEAALLLGPLPSSSSASPSPHSSSFALRLACAIGDCTTEANSGSVLGRTLEFSKRFHETWRVYMRDNQKQQLKDDAEKQKQLQNAQVFLHQISNLVTTMLTQMIPLFVAPNHGVDCVTVLNILSYYQFVRSESSSYHKLIEVCTNQLYILSSVLLPQAQQQRTSATATATAAITTTKKNNTSRHTTVVIRNRLADDLVNALPPYKELCRELNDRVQLSRMYFYLLILPKLISRISIPLLENKVIPVMFLYLQHDNSLIVKRAHRLFAAFFVSSGSGGSTTSDEPLAAVDKDNKKAADQQQQQQQHSTEAEDHHHVVAFGGLKYKLIPYYLKITLHNERVSHVLYEIFVGSFAKILSYVGTTGGMSSSTGGGVQRLSMQDIALVRYCIDQITQKITDTVMLSHQKTIPKALILMLLHMTQLLSLEVLDDVFAAIETVLLRTTPPRFSAQYMRYLYELIANSYDYTRKQTCVKFYLKLANELETKLARMQQRQKQRLTSSSSSRTTATPATATRRETAPTTTTAAAAAAAQNTD